MECGDPAPLCIFEIYAKSADRRFFLVNISHGRGGAAGIKNPLRTQAHSFAP